MAEKSSEKPVVVSPEKEGWLKKRGARMHRWSNRYFALCGSTLVYKLKKDSTTVRRSYDLMAGCILTEVEDESPKKGKHLYSFWIVWPQHEDDKKSQIDEPVSDDEDEKDIPKESHSKPKDLKEIVRSEVNTNRSKQRKAEEELEKHHAVDNNLSMGMKVAAVAVGGVVIGTLTLGIGLIPYMTVVGITAVASGAGVAYQYRRPSDSRLILATESLSDALAWKAAIEDQIVKLEMTKCPRLPLSADPSIIASILGISSAGGGWFKVNMLESTRIMEQGMRHGSPLHNDIELSISNGASLRQKSLFEIFTSASSVPRPWHIERQRDGCFDGIFHPDGVLCRKAQTVIASSPVNVFLALMDTSEEGRFWPRKSGSTLKVVRTVDDHADILGVSIPLESEQCSFYSRLFGKSLQNIRVKGCLSRFWKLDDDGTYVVFFNSAVDYECDAEDFENTTFVGRTIPLKMDAVVSVAPRKDIIGQEQRCDFDMNVNECQLTASIQLQLDNNVCSKNAPGFLASAGVMNNDNDQNKSSAAAPSPWSNVCESSRNLFMNSFIGQVLELKEHLLLSRFDMDFDNEANYHNANTNGGPDDAGKGSAVGLGGRSRSGHAITSQPSHESQSKGRRVSGEGTFPTGNSGQSGRESAESVEKSSTRGRTRSIQLSNEVAALRNLIASKEYELARLQKVMSKKKDGSSKALPPAPSKQLSGAASGTVTTSIQDPEQASWQSARSRELSDELRVLKEKYFRLTEVVYDQKRRRKTKSSKSVAKSDASPLLSQPATSAAERSSPRLLAPLTPAAKSVVKINTSMIKPRADSQTSNPDRRGASGAQATLAQPPHWTLISAEARRKEYLTSHLSPNQRETMLGVLLFTFALVVSLVDSSRFFSFLTHIIEIIAQWVESKIL